MTAQDYILGSGVCQACQRTPCICKDNLTKARRRFHDLPRAWRELFVEVSGRSVNELLADGIDPAYVTRLADLFEDGAHEWARQERT